MADASLITVSGVADNRCGSMCGDADGRGTGEYSADFVGCRLDATGHVEIRD
jgi:hypothetical protein